MPICKKCKKKFSKKIIIDGLLRHCNGRVFCFECSPFGCHNTRSFKEPQICKWHVCSKLTSGTMYCSRACKNKTAVAKKRKKIKLKAIEYKGGKCCKCGYDKCIEALEFHHLNPFEKKFAISGKGHTKSWEKVKEELDKCDLVCANCHREIEADKS